MPSSLMPFEMALKGKLVLSKDPSLIGYNFQSLKNMRYAEISPEGIAGMSVINSSAPTTGGTANPRIKSAFHFRKDGDATDYEHLLAYAYRSTWTNPKIFRLSVDVPATGEFTTTPIFTLSDTTTEREGYFSDAPNGTVAFCDGKEPLIWGGDENQIGKFINFNTSGTINKDYTEALRNSLTDSLNRAKLTKTSTMLFYVGATRPIKSFKAYFDGISTKNNSTGTLTVRYWDGTAWQGVSGLVDGTSSGNKPLRVTGNVSFATTVDVSKPKVIDGICLHWYRVASSGVVSNSHMARMTVNAPMQKVKDIWDGDLRDIVSFQLWDTVKYTEYNTNVLDDEYISNSSQTWVNIAGASYTIVCGFLERMIGVEFHLVDGSKNTNSANLTVQYSPDGEAWTSVDGLVDNTSSGGKSMKVSGIATWDTIRHNHEFESNVNTNTKLYYYKFSWSAALSSPTSVYYVAGITSPKEISDYKFPMFCKNRLWLLNNSGGGKNSAICSAEGTPDVWNGDDTEQFFFGDNSELTGGASLYSIIGSNVFDTALFFKRNAMFGVTGSNPDDFNKYEINITDGLVAPRTLMKAHTFVGDYPRQVLIWQGAKGLYMFDNRVASPIHEDISNFFDFTETSNTRKLHSSYIEKSAAFVDKEHMEYHWLFADASSTGKLNREFVFNLKNGQWHEINRGASGSLQYGFSVMDTNSNNYTYGVMHNGKMTRLENGVTFAGNAIEHELHLGDLAVSKGKTNDVTSIRKLKLISRSTTATANSIIVKHYIDGETNASSSFTLSPFRTGHRITNIKKSLDGQDNGIFHSFKLTLSTTNITNGFSPIYLGGYYENVREDL